MPALEVLPEEMAEARLWARFETPPLSFMYGGRPSAALLGEWPVTRATRPGERQRVEHTATWTDPVTGLVVELAAVEYGDFPTVEWTVYLRNDGSAPTPVLERILPLDARLRGDHAGDFVLHHAVGSPCAPNDYAPRETVLAPKATQRIGAAGGRPTNSDLSYFSLEGPADRGVIVVVGWPGQWSSAWSRDDGGGVQVQAGQELTHLRLAPGERIRTPLMVLQFWRGGWLRGQNLWRRWMLAHNVPRPGGSLPQPELFGCSSHQFGEMVEADEASQREFIDRYLDGGVPIDRWWMDAGWYPCAPEGWPKTGTWEVDPRRFPRGLRAVSDHAHARGVTTILWFEPERVHPGTWLADHHPEWVHGGRAGGLLDLGNPAARTWLTDHVDRLLTEQGIDLYRQDLNMDPLEYWRAADAPDRQGITEIRHVEGYLEYWDELRRRHPGMLIDSCASGGRRNDLETMRRAVPLWRTDWRCEPVGTQGCAYGISLWLPLSGTGAAEVDPYVFRSNMAPFTNCLFDVRDGQLDWDLLRRLVSQWRKVRECYLGDFWPLTPHSVAPDVWIAWQFDLPAAGRGMVQAFRRDQSVYEVARLALRGLDPNAEYEVTDLDSGRTARYPGAALLAPGLRVELAARPAAALLAYRRLARAAGGASSSG